MTNSFHLYPADALGVQEENGGTSAFYTQAHSIYDEANDTTDNWTNRLIWDHRAGSLPDLLPIVLYQEGE